MGHILREHRALSRVDSCIERQEYRSNKPGSNRQKELRKLFASYLRKKLQRYFMCSLMTKDKKTYTAVDSDAKKHTVDESSFFEHVLTIEKN